jgi:dolichyl-phosphate beta-glucosyltransferase
MKRPDLSIVIPAYNESGSIRETILEICLYLSGLGLSYEIIAVDDGSKDSTAAVVTSMIEGCPELRLVQYGANRGKGYAVRTGIIASLGDKVLFTDADNATPITELPAFLEALNSDFDIAIASRNVRGSVRVIHQPTYRELGGKLLNLLIRLFAAPGIKDTQCGFKLFSREVARAIFSKCTVDNFSFDVEVLYLARRLGYKTAELPVHWTHHKGSRVNPIRDGFLLLLDLAKIRFHKYNFDIAEKQS